MTGALTVAFTPRATRQTQRALAWWGRIVLRRRASLRRSCAVYSRSLPRPRPSGREHARHATKGCAARPPATNSLPRLLSGRLGGHAAGSARALAREPTRAVVVTAPAIRMTSPPAAGARPSSGTTKRVARRPPGVTALPSVTKSFHRSCSEDSARPKAHTSRPLSLQSQKAARPG